MHLLNFVTSTRQPWGKRKRPASEWPACVQGRWEGRAGPREAKGLRASQPPTFRRFLPGAFFVRGLPVTSGKGATVKGGKKKPAVGRRGDGTH